MTWSYTLREGLPREQVERARFANVLDRAMSLPGNYMAGLCTAQVVRFNAAHFLDGGAAHLDGVTFQLMTATGLESVPLPNGVDIQIEQIAWIAETND